MPVLARVVPKPNVCLAYRQSGKASADMLAPIVNILLSFASQGRFDSNVLPVWVVDCGGRHSDEESKCLRLVEIFVGAAHFVLRLEA